MLTLYSAIQPTPLGPMTILADDEGLHEVTFSRANLPANALEQQAGHPQIASCIRQLESYFAGSNIPMRVNSRQQGTAFQLKVWKELINIPFGKTLSYLELSKRIGDPKAIRAVGTSNGKNKLAIIVPCHRVIGSNGDLTGYAGELWRKRWLLEHEAKWANGVQTLF